VEQIVVRQAVAMRPMEVCRADLHLQPIADSTLEQFMKTCSPWEGPMLEKLVKDCLLWERAHTGAGAECEESSR